MENEPSQNSKKKPLNSYAQYSAMGFQMVAIILLGTYAGIKLDKYLELEKTPVFTISFSLFSVILSIYFVAKDFMKK